MVAASSSWSHPTTTCKADEDSIRSLSPSSPLFIFHPNPDLEICFDTRTRTPVYVLERLRPSAPKSHSTTNCESSTKERRPHFVEETSLPEIFRSRNFHYRHSGYDRGHMAPAADFESGGVDTFTLINACPQSPSLNRKLWNRLEHWVRRVAQREEDDHKTVVVITGPLWLPVAKTGDGVWEYRYPALGQNAPSLVSVPTHFFKLVAIIRNGKIVKYAAFCVPNKEDLKDSDSSLEQYLVRWSDLEAVVGMQFFPFLIVRDDWRALADEATEAVWAGERLLLLLPCDAKTTKKRGAKSGDNNNNAPQHLCRAGVCK